MGLGRSAHCVLTWPRLNGRVHSNSAPRLVARLLAEAWSGSVAPSGARIVCGETASILLLILINQEWRASANPFRAVLRRLHDLTPEDTPVPASKITSDGARASFAHIFQFVCTYVLAAAAAADRALEPPFFPGRGRRRSTWPRLMQPDV